ncbi:MAG: PAS domain S-box protein [Gammaproteobacteria bacterium]|nr:PAS domain S-box protein [Gammaproteobacteria bacterium]
MSADLHPKKPFASDSKAKLNPIDQAAQVAYLQQAHEALIRSEERFRLLVENVQDYAIFMLDPAGHMISWNAGAERIKGYKAAEVLGKHFSLFYPLKDIAVGKPQEMLKLTAAQGRVEDEGWRVRKDGSRFWANVVITALRGKNGQLEGFAKVTRDVTEQRRAEARYYAVTETANDAIITADSAGTIVYFNPAAVRIFGYSMEEAVGQSLMLFMPKRFQQEHRQSFERIIAGGEKQLLGKTLELIGRRKDASEFPLELSLASWKVGEEVFFTGIVRDITQRKNDAEKIAQLNQYLEQRALELEAINKELEAFSYSVSHDLRAPLRAMDGFSRAVLERYAGQLDAEGQDYLRRIRAASQRMGQLIDDLLRLARITRSELHLTTVNLSSIAEEIVAELQRRPPSREVKIAIAADMSVTADANLMRVMLTNLLDNAWKFTAKQSDARIEFGYTQTDNGKIFFVRDNGAGFDMAYADKLFGVFQRLHAAGEFEGTGIGLATVQRIVHRHGARIWAEAEPGRGAAFYFSFSS